MEIGEIIQDRFKVTELIGEGSFGQVYKVVDTKNNNDVFALKVEVEQEEEECMLEREIKILIQLKKKQGFPQIKFYGQESNYVYYIMNLLGPNLEKTAKKCGGTFSIGTVLKVAIQILHRIEALHISKFIHRDIKPDNFVLGISQNIINLIDFGLSKQYVNSKGEHIKLNKKKGLIGTARYASVNAHNEMEQSRRDDLESIAYVLVYLGTGTLPWMNLQIEQRDLKYAKILHLKKNTKPELICQHLPQVVYIQQKCFHQFLSEVKQLEFAQTPTYSEYRKLFQSELEKMPHQIYDWERLQEHQKKKNLTMHIKPQEEPLKIEQNKNFIQTPISGQFAKFDEFMNKNQIKSSKKSGSPNRKVIINVIEPDCILDQQIDQSFSFNLQAYVEQSGIKSQTLLLPPNSPLPRSDQQRKGSVATSRINFYDWSEQEINSEGPPIWNQTQDSSICENTEQTQTNTQKILNGIGGDTKKYIISIKASRKSLW
ncbi:hypothetical protein pb186bvf_012676 [Paramecium bursaria]